MPVNAWDEITHPLPNLNGYTVEVCEWISNFIPHFDGYNYLPMLGLKLNHIGKSGIWKLSRFGSI